MVSPGRAPQLDPAQQRRLEQLMRAYFDLAWRTLRRLGVAEADLQDAAQSVFGVVASKLPSISVEREKSFVFGTAMRVASTARRSQRRKREAPLEDAGTLWDHAPDPEQALERRQAVSQLAEILSGMDEPARSVFVLFELEQLTLAEIAELEQVPVGTATSRLRRARQYFQRAVAGPSPALEAVDE
jgi:RNA polymerase sigma-70 factor, ECF subfamily